MGLVLTASLGERRARAGGERGPLFWFWVLHPSCQTAALGTAGNGLGLRCSQLSPTAGIPPRGRQVVGVLWWAQRDEWVEVFAHKSGLLCALLLAQPGKRIYSALENMTES